MSSTKPRIERPKSVAGGIPAIVASVRHSWREMGFTRSLRTLLTVNQKRGFDCPGCAWPDPDGKRAITEFCENGAKAVAEEATQKKVTRAFFAEHSLSSMRKQEEYWLGKQGRLTEPMWCPPGEDHYQPISWEDTFEKIGTKLKSLDYANEAVFYTSGRASNEAAFLYQLFARRFGTNNLPDCSNMCHESSGVGLKEVIGIGKGTVTLDDFSEADCIVVIGQNPGTNHPRMLTALQTAARNGCSIISVNPLVEAGLQRFIHPQEISTLLGKGTELTSHYVQIRINGDVAFLKGVMKELLAIEEQQGGVLDQEFIQQKTVGFTEFRAELADVSWSAIEQAAGVDRAEMLKVAQTIARSKRMIICWAMGITQHRNAVANVQEIVNLLLLGGHMGRVGAGVCPVRGHSNVQGDRTMGICEKPSETFLDRLEETYQFKAPREHGYDTVEALHAMHRESVKVFVSLGGNFYSATPDTNFTAEALERCDLTVQISTKLNRSHVYTGKEALLLPCLARSERDQQRGEDQFVSVENSMGFVHVSQGSLAPQSPELRSEVAIICGMARGVFPDDEQSEGNIDWQRFRNNYARIRRNIEHVIPGFEDYDERLKKGSGFYLPNPIRDSCSFSTKDGKAHFTVHPIETVRVDPGQYLMMTIRSHNQYNTTIYGLDDRYRGVYSGRKVLFMHPKDMEREKFQKLDQVDITSHFKGETRIAREFSIVPYSIPQGCLASYFPETNVLVPVDSTARRSNTPTSKSIVVSLSRV